MSLHYSLAGLASLLALVGCSNGTEPLRSTAPLGANTQVCETLDRMRAPTELGPRWNQAAYDFWATLIDTALHRSDYIDDPTGVLTTTRSFQMPFLKDSSPAGCKTLHAQVFRPNPNLQKVSRLIACPTKPHFDVSGRVAAALSELANAQVTAKSPIALELDFAPNCTYYFISTGASAALSVPDVTDLTINGGTSLQDAATLVVANPTALVAADFSPSVYLLTSQTNGGPTSAPEDAVSIRNGGQRIALTNLKLTSLTPPILNGTTRWDLEISYVDLGTISPDPNSPGNSILTVPSNTPGNLVIYNTNIRQVDAAEPTAPEDLLTTAPSVELGGGGIEPIVYSGTGKALVMASPSFAALPAGPVKIGHTTGTGSTHFAFAFSQPNDATPLQDLSLINVELNDWNGIAFTVAMDKGLLLENFRMVPGGTAHKTATGGGLIVGQLQSDLILENSQFLYGGDDGVNIRSNFDSVATVPSFDGGTTSFQVQGGSFNLQSGTPLCFLSPSFDPLLCASVSSFDSRTHTLELSGDQRTSIDAGDFLFRSDRPAARVFVTRSTFEGNRARGILTKGSDVYISGNQFSHTQGPGVFVAPENATYTEGPISRNVIVSANSFDYNTASLYFGAIGVGLSESHQVVQSQTLRNILIENNSLNNQIGPAVLTASSGYVDVRSNTWGTIDLSAYAAGKWWLANDAGVPLTPVVSLDP